MKTKVRTPRTRHPSHIKLSIVRQIWHGWAGQHTSDEGISIKRKEGKSYFQMSRELTLHSRVMTRSAIERRNETLKLSSESQNELGLFVRTLGQREMRLNGLETRPFGLRWVWSAHFSGRYRVCDLIFFPSCNVKNNLLHVKEWERTQVCNFKAPGFILRMRETRKNQMKK